MSDPDTSSRAQRVRTLFDQAVELDWKGRVALLDRECAGDRDLRREVEALVEAHESEDSEAEGVLQALRSDGGPAGTQSSDSLRDHLLGSLADQYRIEEQIGRGGMARVYRALDLKHRRQVAVKVMNPELAALIGPDRFLREIENTARLRHPHILPLFDSGEADGLPYYVMPLVSGGSLRDRLKGEGQLPIEDILAITRSVAEALDAAAEDGLVHRDIKPENILLERGQALIADFGIARAIADFDAAGGTTTWVVVGTPEYMSPEQAANESTIDSKSDQYSLACVVYEMLGGRTPFSGRPSGAIIASQVCEAAPSIQELRPSVPEGMAAALEKALQKDPGDRYGSAQEFVQALAHGAGLLAPSVESASAPSIARKPDRRGANRLLHRVSGSARQAPYWLGIASVLGVALIVGSLFAVRTVLSPSSGTGTPIIGVIEFRNETGDPSFDALGRQALDWVTQGLQSSGLSSVVPSEDALVASQIVREVAADANSANALRRFARETTASWVVHGSLHLNANLLTAQAQLTDVDASRVIGTVGPLMAHPDSAGSLLVDLSGRIVSLVSLRSDTRIGAESGLSRRPPSLGAYRLFDDGLTLYLGGSYESAIAPFLAAYHDDTTFVAPLIYASIAASNARDYVRADSILRVAEQRRTRLTPYYRGWLDYRRAFLRGDRSESLRIVRELARDAPGSKAVYNYAVEALENGYFEEARTAIESLSPDEGPMRDWLGYWNVITHIYHVLGDHGAELRFAHEAIGRHPTMGEPLWYAARAHAALGQVDSARAHLADARTRPRGPQEASIRFELDIGIELLSHDQNEDGLQHLRDIRETAETDPGLVSPRQLQDLLIATEAWEEASSHLRTLNSSTVDSIQLLGWTGLIAAATGDIGSAEAALEALARTTESFPYGDRHVERARIEARLGRASDALQHLGQAFSEGKNHGRWVHQDRSLALIDLPAPYAN